MDQIEFQTERNVYDGYEDAAGLKSNFNFGLVQSNIRTNAEEKHEVKTFSKEVHAFIYAFTIVIILIFHTLSYIGLCWCANFIRNEGNA